jgi:glycosyltransferase involved in cell wall biosynthesis
MALLRNRIYYRVKPFIPRPLRAAIRRGFARRLEERIRDVWPIMPGSEKPPAGWQGWPENKKFAVVLTHDVEAAAGLRHCRRLMGLEFEMGFHSSFNFIPEGNYSVSVDLRSDIVKHGFEVGVHDLRHDGRLFQSRRDFAGKAAQINHYLRDWGASGFRSGFMLHNLDWLHDLNICYDASTFDTDPFEPQPEGRHTIFPFWVTDEQYGDGSKGYVELPYTLPQDSTLFLVLREGTPQIWLRKLDWIAEHGGMALINVHPDYIRFEDERASNRTYPVRYYRELLAHLRDRYGTSFWQPLPSQLAQFVALLNPRPIVRRAKRVCMVSYSFYESDNRVTRYAQALAARGDHVDVFALRRKPATPAEEVINGVHVFRIQDRFGKTEQSKLAYLLPLLRFVCNSSAWITRKHAQQKYDLIHVHNVPDFMVFSAWYPKITGTPIILDIHDIVPEFFASKFQVEHRRFIFTLLAWMERASAFFADQLIVANHLWLEKYAVRTGTADRCIAFINNVDSTIFLPQPKQRTDEKKIILFPGGLQWHQGVDIALRAFQKVRSTIPVAEFHIYGEGNARDSLVGLAEELELNGSVRFFEPKSVNEIAGIMAQADLGVVPKRADSFGNEAYSTKILEFMAVGVPVVVSSTKVDRYYFDDSVVRFFPSGDTDALAEAMLEVLKDSERRRTLVAAASAYANCNSWDNRKADYLSLVDDLCRSRRYKCFPRDGQATGDNNRSSQPADHRKEPEKLVR